VEGAHHLYLEVPDLGLLHKLLVRFEGVVHGRWFGDAPPHIHHEAIRSDLLDAIENLLQMVRIFDLPTAVDKRERHHQVDLGRMGLVCRGHCQRGGQPTCKKFQKRHGFVRLTWL